jgi:cytosine/adenosine deaminase-related metal-dependent hydrolase
LAPQVEVQMGHGWPPTLRAIELGLRPGLSIDVVTTVPGDMFTQMRSAFGSERGRINERAYEPNEQVPKDCLTAEQMLRAATIDGAYVAGLEDRTGSLTPGKQADVVIIDAHAINLAPVIDPIAAVVLCADVSNVDTVMVAGEVKKRGGTMVADIAKAVDDVRASTEYLSGAVAAKQSA